MYIYAIMDLFGRFINILMQPTLYQSYIELLKKTLLNEIYLENELRIQYLSEKLNEEKPFWKRNSQGVDYRVLHHIRAHFPEKYTRIAKGREVGDHLDYNLQHLVYAHSMIGRKRMNNIEECAQEILEQNIPGDFMECGVWQGGASIFMRGILSAYGDKERKVWLADSFEGLPAPEMKEDEGLIATKNEAPGLAVSLEVVKQNFAKYSLLDEQVRFIKGWFKDTLPNAPVRQISLLRLDGDLFESTMTALNSLYHKVSAGGFIIIDDYGALKQCRAAVDQFREKNNITTPMHTIDWTGVYWKKES